MFLGTLVLTKNLTAAAPLVMSLLLLSLAVAETPVQAWVQRYSVPPLYTATATALAVDSTNNVIVTGYGPRSGTGTYFDYATIKYSSTGVPLWTNYYNGPGSYDDQAMAIAVDSKDNVIVTGNSSTAGADAHNFDYATIKYSGTGVPLWTNRYNSPWSYNDRPTAVVVDTNNDIIVTGRSRNNMTPHYSYYATVKYSSAGVPLWTNFYHGSTGTLIMDGATAVAVDGNNDVIVTGHSDNATYAAYDYATIKYSSAGVPLWTNRYNWGSTFGATAYAVVVDNNNNNVIVSGVVLGASSSFYSTIKYSSAGVPLWTNACAGPTDGGGSGSTAAALDGNGDVVVTGHIIHPSGSSEFATIEYSTDGQPLWTNRYSGVVPYSPYTDYKTCSLAVDLRNNVIVSGYSPGNAGDADYAAIKYSSSGVAIWTNSYNGPGNGNDFAQQAVLDHNGNVIVTGISLGSRTNSEFATVKYAFPLVFANCELTNGMFQGQLDNLQTGALVIEASTDLAGWEPIFTNTTPTNILFYTDLDATNYTGRYYRAHQSP